MVGVVVVVVVTVLAGVRVMDSTLQGEGEGAVSSVAVLEAWVEGWMDECGHGTCGNGKSLKHMKDNLAL